jgi:hypothetical protein
MDDPMVRSRLGRTKRNAAFGALDPKRGPLFFCSPAAFNSEFGVCVLSNAPERRCLRVFYPAKHWNSRTTQNVFDHCLAQAGRVVIEREAIRFFVIVKFLKAEGIGEFTQGSKLLRAQANL